MTTLKKVFMILMAITCLQINSFTQDLPYSCPTHGGLYEEEVITITWASEEYHICLQCFLEFLKNNSKELNRLIKHVKEWKEWD